MQDEKRQLTIRPIEPTDDLSAFDSGNADLDEWLRKNALRNERRFGTTRVAVDGDTVVGFVTVAARSVERRAVRGQGGPADYPGLLIARMAVARGRQGQGIGKLLLTEAFRIAIEQHTVGAGCAAVVVDAKPEAVAFYAHHHFKRIKVAPGTAPSDQVQMYLSIETVLEAAGLAPTGELIAVE